MDKPVPVWNSEVSLGAGFVNGTIKKLPPLCKRWWDDGPKDTNDNGAVC